MSRFLAAFFIKPPTSEFTLNFKCLGSLGFDDGAVELDLFFSLKQSNVILINYELINLPTRYNEIKSAFSTTTEIREKLVYRDVFKDENGIHVVNNVIRHDGDGLALGRRVLVSEPGDAVRAHYELKQHSDILLSTYYHK